MASESRDYCEVKGAPASKCVEVAAEEGVRAKALAVNTLSMDELVVLEDHLL